MKRFLAPTAIGRLADQIVSECRDGRRRRRRNIVAIAASAVVALCVLGPAALPASALTISNEDPDPHTITVTAGTDTKQVTVEPDQ